jgi:hypothetical protein
LDPLIKSQLLYQLSYAPVNGPAVPLPKTTSLGFDSLRRSREKKPVAEGLSQRRATELGSAGRHPTRMPDGPGKSVIAATFPCGPNGYTERAPRDKQKHGKD